MFILGLFIAPIFVTATGNIPTDGSSLTFTNPIKVDSIDDLLTTLLKVAGRIGAIVAVFFFIYAGFLYVTARGDEDSITKAHETLKWTAVGTAVLIGASALAAIIQSTVNSLK